MFFSRWRYYLLSIPKLLFGFKNWLTVVRLFAGLPVAQPTIVEVRNGPRFKVRTAMDVWIIKEICLDHDYEISSVPFQNGWTIIDIGAGLGDFAVTIGRQNPQSSIYAFEPFPESFALLQENIALNTLKNVQAFPAAVSGESSELRLHIGTGEAVEHSTAKQSADPGAVVVQGIALADVFSQHNLARCDYLKVDCEGAEFDIFLQASAETLHKITHICIEYHDHVTPHHHRELVALFEQHGFQVRTRPNPVHSYLGMLYAARPASA